VTAHYAELRERAYDANREIVGAGLVVLTFGNASAVDRPARVMAIKPSGVPYDVLGPVGMVVVDLETGAALDGAYRPSSDTPTHLALYRSFQRVGGIVHTHSPLRDGLGAGLPRHSLPRHDARRPLLRPGACHAPADASGDRGRLRAAHRGRDRRDALRPRARPARDAGRARRLARALRLGSRRANAVENAIALEAVAAAAYRTELLRSAVEPIGDDLLRRHFLRKHGPTAYYGQPG
jgi:L-ribulose-5-phosphate 4-epimerase